VLGYSLGARVALGLCLEYPELFSRAALIGVNPGITEPSERTERVRWEQGFIEVLEREGLAAFLAQWEELPLFRSQASLPAEARAVQRHIRASHRAEGLAHALRVLGTGQMPDYFPELGRLKLPVLLVAGENDVKFRSIAERAQALLQNARIAVVPGAGHNPLIEAPDALLASIELFLTAPSLATPSLTSPSS
jgi:2-succinyl-6-hydroxy-2,4-cyclohexadiene-1-carboxylate synthase